MQPEISMQDTIKSEEVLALYKENGWSSAEKPDTTDGSAAKLT